ncbi:MAG TPA: hypothetical protein DEP51_05755 [Clostridiales bacterium]|nr:hypothetical protein [Clostridiales bacterium]
MTLLESYYQTIDGYAEQAKKMDKIEDKEIDAICQNAKNKIENMYGDMKKAGDKSEKINPILNQIIEELESLKKRLHVEDKITFARRSEGQDR